MTSADELSRFINEALTRGLPRAQIEDVLVKAGWSAAQVKGALGAFADVTFPVPVPRPRPYMDAREAFLYLVAFSTMYLSAYNFGSLVFQFIERAFPELGVTAITLREAIRWPVSVLVVALPVFLYASRLINQDTRLDPSKRVSEIRRKLTYLTLFISACVLIGIFTNLVYSFLGGELTIRFALKTFTAAAIAGAVFGYYLRDLRLDGTEAKA